MAGIDLRAQVLVPDATGSLLIKTSKRDKQHQQQKQYYKHEQQQQQQKGPD